MDETVTLSLAKYDKLKEAEIEAEKLKKLAKVEEERTNMILLRMTMDFVRAKAFNSSRRITSEEMTKTLIDLNEYSENYIYEVDKNRLIIYKKERNKEREELDVIKS